MPGVSFPAPGGPLSLWVPGGSREGVGRTWACRAQSLTVGLVGGSLVLQMTPELCEVHPPQDGRPSEACPLVALGQPGLPPSIVLGYWAQLSSRAMTLSLAENQSSGGIVADVEGGPTEAVG